MSSISIGRTHDYSEKGTLIICLLKRKEENPKKDNKETIKKSQCEI